MTVPTEERTGFASTEEFLAAVQRLSSPAEFEGLARHINAYRWAVLLRNAPVCALSQENLRAAVRSERHFVMLLRNPHLDAGAWDAILDAALDILAQRGDSQALMGCLEERSARGLPTPERVQEAVRNVVLGEGRRVHHHLLTTMPDASEEDLIRMIETMGKVSADEARAVLLHPSATEMVWAEAARRDIHGLYQIVWREKSLLGLPWIRRALLCSPITIIVEEIGPHAEGDELRRWLRRMLELEGGARAAATHLGAMPPERLCALRPEDLQALLQCSDAEARLTAIRIVAALAEAPAVHRASEPIRTVLSGRAASR